MAKFVATWKAPSDEGTNMPGRSTQTNHCKTAEVRASPALSDSIPSSILSAKTLPIGATLVFTSREPPKLPGAERETTAGESAGDANTTGDADQSTQLSDTARLYGPIAGGQSIAGVTITNAGDSGERALHAENLRVAGHFRFVGPAQQWRFNSRSIHPAGQCHKDTAR